MKWASKHRIIYGYLIVRNKEMSVPDILIELVNKVEDKFKFGEEMSIEAVCCSKVANHLVDTDNSEHLPIEILESQLCDEIRYAK